MSSSAEEAPGQGLVIGSSRVVLSRVATLLLIAVALLTLLVVTLSTVLAVTGFPVRPALAALWEGSFGSWYVFGSATLVRATPLILTGLAVTLAFRAGIWNIGAEGQLLVGAACVAAAAVHVPALHPLLALPLLTAIGGLAGATWAGIAALLRRGFGVLEVISTIMLNFIAAHLVGYLVRGPLQEPLGIYPQSAELPGAFRIPALASGTRLTWALPLAITVACVLWLFLTRSAWGFRVRAIGANPVAADVAGEISVPVSTFRIFLWSGAIAGIAGALEIMGVTSSLYENLSPGYGYTAIAVAMLARLHPLVVVASAILFGSLEAGAASMQRTAGVPSVVVWIVEAVLLLAVLLAGRVRGGQLETWLGRTFRQSSAV